MSISAIASSEPVFVLFVSDLQVGNPSVNKASALSRQMLFDFICGRLGGSDERALAAKIAR
jgi:tRNA G37 N-methylase TrmD